jgi:hypothetical protein
MERMADWPHLPRAWQGFRPRRVVSREPRTLPAEDGDWTGKPVTKSNLSLYGLYALARMPAGLVDSPTAWPAGPGHARAVNLALGSVLTGPHRVGRRYLVRLQPHAIPHSLRSVPGGEIIEEAVGRAGVFACRRARPGAAGQRGAGEAKAHSHCESARGYWWGGSAGCPATVAAAFELRAGGGQPTAVSALAAEIPPRHQRRAWLR